MLKKIKKSIDTIFRFVLSLNETNIRCAKIYERRAIIGLIALRTLGNGGVRV